MYLPKHFEESSIDGIHALIRERPLATLVTLTADGLNANHIPFLLQSKPDPYGRLQGHVPRANPLTQTRLEEVEALAIFHGPEGYISPSWYPLKQETGKVVPTWNYRVVHAYGRLDVIDDAAWVRRQIEALTEMNESRFANPWAVDDAPRDYTEKLIGALIGIEIVITRLLGKTKANQNHPESNRAGLVAGLNGLDDPAAAELAALTRDDQGKPFK